MESKKNSAIDIPLVLLVDSDIVVLRTWSNILRSRYRVMTARDLRGAVRSLSSRPHVLICAHRLSDGSGLEFLRDIYRRGIVPVRVLFSADIDAFPWDESDTDEVLRFHPRPADSDALFTIIDDALHKCEPILMESRKHCHPKHPRTSDRWRSFFAFLYNYTGDILIGMALAALVLIPIGLLVYLALRIFRYTFGLDFPEVS